MFPDQDLGTDGAQTDQEREIAENTPAGQNIGAPVRATDSGDVLTYSLGGTDETSFDINRATGQLSTKAALDHETKGTYEMEVTATDPFGEDATAAVTIEVTDVNEDPTITGSPAAVISFAEIGETTNLPTYTAIDQDEDETDSLEWSLKGADEGQFDISSAGVLTFDGTPNYESPGDANRDNDYKVTIVVTDAKGNTDEHDVTVTVTNVEEDGTVTLSTLQPRVGVELTADLTDPDLDITDLTWAWSKSGADFTEDDRPTTASYTPVSGDIGATLTATATYKDGMGTNEDTATLASANTVIADIRNKAPKFPDQDDETEGDQTDQEREVPENYATGQSYGGDADNDYTHPNIGAPVVATDNQFETTTSATSVADTLTYTLGGTDAASFDINRTTAQLQAKAALDHEDKDTYTVTVTATDPSGLSATVNVTIEVTDVDEAPEITVHENVAPEFADSEDGARRVAENTVAGEDIGNPVAASDANGDALTYALSGTDAASFTIDPDTGQLMTLADLDYETKASYSVTVAASDSGGLSDSIDVTITVTDVDENVAPEFADSEDGARRVAENTVAGEDIGNPVAASDANGDALTYALSGTDAASFTIDPDTGQLMTLADLDYETKASYSVTVAASDSGGLSDSIDVTITVTDVDENVAPEFADSEDGARRVAENTVAGEDIGNPVAASDANGDALTYALSGTDAASFTIDPDTGQLMTLADLDYETKASYSVTVAASDSGGLSDSIDVTITVTDVDENVAPEFADSEDGARRVAENTVAGEDIGNPVAASDANGDALTYALSGTDAASFTIDPDTGQLMTLADLDYETKASYSVTVAASDSGGLSDSIDVTITVTDVDENVAPEFADSEDGARRVAENTVAGEGIGNPVAASDANGDALTYALSGTDAAFFAIDLDTGQLMTLADLDYETKASYSVTVAASDSGGLSDSIDVTITVTDVEKPGTVTLSADPQVGVELTASLADPDGNVSGEAWQWARDDGAGGFEDIASATSAAYTPGADDEGKQLRATVTYTDDDGADKSAEVTSAAVEPEAATCGPPEDRYDTNGENGIQKSEVLTAINDYLFGGVDCEITKSEVLRLINLYLFG